MRRAALIVVGAVLLSVFAAERAFCADLVGLVADAHAHPVANVKIIVGNLAGKAFGEAQTDTAGHYRITQLAPGTYKYDLDPLASGFKGGDAVAALGPEGLTINWRVSAAAPAIALASAGTEVALANDPFGFSPLGFVSLVTVGAAAVAAGVVGGYGAAGGFSGSSASPSH